MGAGHESGMAQGRNRGARPCHDRMLDGENLMSVGMRELDVRRKEER